MRKKQKGALALSVILASSLSAPSIAMAADTTTLETNQIEVSAEANTAAAEQPAAPVTDEQPAAPASNEQPAALVTNEQPAAPASSEQPAAPVSEPASNYQAVDSSTETAGANDPESSAKSSADVDNSDASNSSESAERDSFSSEQSQEAGDNAGEVQKAPQQETQKGIEEPAVDPATTVPNNVDEVVPREKNDKQGTDITYKANTTFLGWNISLADSTTTITPEHVNNGKTLGEVSDDFQGTDFEKVKAGDLVVKGDMSIKGDTAKDAAHDVEKDSKYDVKADLDVSAIHTAIGNSVSMLGKQFGGADAAQAVYVNGLETGLRSTFKFGNGLNGIILMDLDLTQMGERENTYSSPQKGHDKLYGENGVKENFNHEGAEYGLTYDTSTFGNLKTLIKSSAQKISLLLKDVMFHSATGNSTTTENDTETRTTTEGSIEGTLVGYMKADVGHNRVKGNVSYVWGAMQEADGRDVNATGDHENHVMLSVSLTETTPKNIPSTPDSPSTPDTPSTPDSPSTPDTSSTLDTPTTPEKPSTPSVKKPSTTHKKVTQTTNVVTESKMPESPATGDTSNLYLWFLSMIASFGVCVTSLIHFGRKKSSRFHD